MTEKLGISECPTGIYGHIREDEYHADWTRISKHGLDKVARSPYHYWAETLAPDRVVRESTPAMELGRATHTAVFEPHRFTELYAVAPRVDRRTSAGKAEYAEFEAANAGKTLLSADGFAQCLAMREAVAKNRHAYALLAAGGYEQTILWDDWEYGVKCRGRADWITASGVIVDLKTTDRADHNSFQRTCINFGYHRQAAYYNDGLAQAAGWSIEPERPFIFLVVEKNPPYAVAIYAADSEMLRLGRNSIRVDLRTYSRCVESKTWPGLGESIMPLSAPRWAFSAANDN